MPTRSEKFSKSERLCSKKAIAELFENGRSFYSSSFQIIWISTDNKMRYPVQVAVSVSKKSFKKAVDRNLIRRRIREAWRKNKDLLYGFLERRNLRIVLMIIFKDTSIPVYSMIEKSLLDTIRKLITEISSAETIC